MTAPTPRVYGRTVVLRREQYDHLELRNAMLAGTRDGFRAMIPPDRTQAGPITMTEQPCRWVREQHHKHGWQMVPVETTYETATEIRVSYECPTLLVAEVADLLAAARAAEPPTLCGDTMPASATWIGPVTCDHPAGHEGGHWSDSFLTTEGYRW